jgi:hypothetical protein
MVIRRSVRIYPGSFDRKGGGEGGVVSGGESSPTTTGEFVTGGR